MAILYVAAEAFELKPFAELLTGLRKLNWPIDYAYEGIWEGRRVLLAANGAGPSLAARAVELAVRAVSAADLSSSRLEAVVSTGLCGAVDPRLALHQIVVADSVLDGASGKLISCCLVEADTAHVVGRVISQNRVAVTAAEKETLQSTGAIAVEMEAAGVALRTQRTQVPFFCIKVVSDTAKESFVFDLNRMRTTEGRIARGKIIVHALAHPGSLRSLMQLKRRSESAARVLGEFLVSCRIQVESSGHPSATEE